MKRLTWFGLMSVAALLMTTRDAHAYLDPGTGSMLLQGLIAGIAAASVATRRLLGQGQGVLLLDPEGPQSAGPAGRSA